MIRRTTWIFVALFVILLGVLFYLQRADGTGAGAETPTLAAAFFLDTQEKDIDGLRIADDTGQSVAVARGEDGSWTLVEPAGQPADTARIEAAILQAESWRIVDALENAPPADVAGLEPPQYRVEATLSDGGEQTALIGDQTPVQNGYYARLEGGPVVVVAQTSADTLIELLATPPIAVTPSVTGAQGTGTLAAPGTPSVTESGAPAPGRTETPPPPVTPAVTGAVTPSGTELPTSAP
jgi:hypothetical protein